LGKESKLNLLNNQGMNRENHPGKSSYTNKRVEVDRQDPSPALPIGEGDLDHIHVESTEEIKQDLTHEVGEKKPEYITANPYTYPLIKDYREGLKDHQTDAELLLWKYLRNKNTGHKIRRQHVIGDFIADFVCLSKKVVIEIDGRIHKFQKEQDNIRTKKLNNLGYEVIRFTNDEVLNSPESVVEFIKDFLNKQPDAMISPSE